MGRPTLRLIGKAAVVVGLFLLARVIYRATAGTLIGQFSADWDASWMKSVYALGLSLPVPFHVISVGLILQKRWLSRFWAKTAWVAVVVSGCWLGVALAIKLLVL